MMGPTGEASTVAWPRRGKGGKGEGGEELGWGSMHENIKLIARMDCDSGDDFLSLINPSSEHVYYSTTFSNHDLSMFNRFVS
jgi:hypothetical protein